jgi:hypothetical protein
MRHWERVLVPAGKETTLSQPWRIYLGAGSALITPFTQTLAYRQPWHVTTLYTAIVAGLSVYFVLTIGEFGFKFFRVQADVYREAIHKRAESCGASAERLKITAFTIRQQNQSALVVAVLVELGSRQGALPTTIHDFQLFAAESMDIAGKSEQSISLGSGDMKRVQLEFRIPTGSWEKAKQLAVRSDWILAARDSQDAPLRSAIFEHRFDGLMRPAQPGTSNPRTHAEWSNLRCHNRR